MPERLLVGASLTTDLKSGVVQRLRVAGVSTRALTGAGRRAVACLHGAGGILRVRSTFMARSFSCSGGLVAGLVLGTSAPGMDPQIVLFVFLPPLIHAAVWFLDPGFTGS